MKILFIAPRFPLPANTGARIRTYNLIKELSAQNDVTLLSFSFDMGSDSKNSETLKKRGIKVNLVSADDRINPFSIFGNKPLTIAKYYSGRMADAISENLGTGGFDVVHFDHLHMGQYNRLCNGTPAVIDEHNVESVIYKRLWNAEKNFFVKMILGNEYKKMEHLEREICRGASFVSVVSEQDRDTLTRLCAGRLRAEVVPNGVDTEYFKTRDEGRGTRDEGREDVRTRDVGSGIRFLDSRRSATLTRNDRSGAVGMTKEQSLVFTGSMDWMPNSDAVEYFCNDILPLIWKKKGDVKFYVVGKNPTKRIIELGEKDNRIVVTGEVDDVRPYMEKAKVFVVPLRIGGGTRLKILEAMSMQKAVVSTSIGAEGIACTENSDIMLADNPQDFADKVLSLLENDKKADEIGLKGRELVCNKYDWRIIGGMLNKVYKDVIASEGI